MDKLHICTVQGRALLFTLVMLFLAPLSMVTFGQSPCTSPVVRQMTDAKSTNANIYDDISIAMTNLLNDGSQTAWQLESGGTFTENVDGTARMQGVIKQFGDYASPRRMAIDIILSGKTYTPDVSGPYNQTGVPTDSWYYFTSLSGTMTGLDVLAGGQLSLSIHMHPFQAGIGANQIFNAEDQVANGGGGWFEWTVVSQPTDATLQFTNYIPGVTVSDIAILISGTPSVPCITPPNPCDGIVSIRQVTSTATNCGNATPYAMYFGGKYYTAGPDLIFTEYTNGTAILKGTVVRNGLSFNINITYSGKTTTAPASSPKLELCATAANTNNGAGWTYYTDMTGTVQTENCVCNVLRRGPSFQVGNFANLQQNKFGASGWFSCTNNTNTGDFNFNLGPARNCGTCDTDTEPPVFSNCPTNITKDVTTMTGSCWNITWTVPTATDNCSTPVVTSNYNPGCCLPIGLTTITYTATDAKGNATVCQFTVTITRTPTCNVSGNKSNFCSSTNSRFTTLARVRSVSAIKSGRLW